MLAKVLSYGLIGLTAYPIEIEVDITCGLPSVTVVGLADTAIKESKERVKSAIKNSGFEWPADRITISLAPSDIRKEGTCFDLAIALGILAASGQIAARNLTECCILGELSLDGTVRPTKGVLPVSIALSKQSAKHLIIPAHNINEASLIPDIIFSAAQTLRHAAEIAGDPGNNRTVSLPYKTVEPAPAAHADDFSDVKGQHTAKRAIEIAVSGGHNLLLIGPPGSGKSMLAKRIPTILPDMTFQEMLDITQIHSIAGTLPPDKGLITTHPFRSPHHTISHPALVGGGAFPQPGEITLAHLGVLFLDELPEFSRTCLEALRQPLENGFITISRLTHSVVFPASCMLVCAMNPCPCGMLGQSKPACRCSISQIAHYRSKISGPLLDRIDLHIEVPPARYQELSGNMPAETSAQIKERIHKVRMIQRERFKDETIMRNVQMSHRQVRKFCALGTEESEMLKMAMAELNFSARTYDKILKVSRTIADLAASTHIKTEHVAEAIQYRSLDRNFFV